MFEVIAKVDSVTVPDMYEGMKGYQFEIEVKGNAPKSQTSHSRGGSFFGGLIKGWTHRN